MVGATRGARWRFLHGGLWCGLHAFEQVLVLQHESLVIDLEFCLEAFRDAEVDVPQPVRTEPVVPLPRALDRHRGRIDVAGVERETRAGGRRRAPDREGV